MPSKEYQEYFKTLSKRPPASIEETRKSLETLMEKYPLPEGVKIHPFSIGPIQAYWAEPSQAEKQPILLYFHGGGYSGGSFLTHRTFFASLAKSSGIRALFFEYRLAPEYPFPAALEDAMTVYKWLLHHPFPHNHIAFVGDSAGGGLLLSLLLKLKLGQEPLPKAAACICPWVDLAKNEYADRIDLLESARLFEAAKMYAGKHDPKEPYISPTYGDLTELPKMLIQTGSQELLYEEILELAEKIPRAELKIWPEMFHCWSIFPEYPEAKLGIEQVGSFLKQAFQSQ